MRSLSIVGARLFSLPDSVSVALILAVAVFVRIAFLFRAPPFYIGGDSPTYLDPAIQLLQGAGFDPIAKRPPLYPLFLAATLATFGWDLQGLNFTQHLLGIGTALSAWALGRMIYGRLAGLLAGLLTALNGYLLVYEHYVMSETLFTFLLSLTVLSVVFAARQSAIRWWLIAGLGLGLASATRQSALPLISMVPLALLLARTSWQQLLRCSAIAAIGFLLVVLPWLIFDLARHGTVSSSTFGETLIWRLTRSEDDLFKWRLGPSADPALQDARRFAFGQAADRVLPSDTKVELQRRFGLDERIADSVLRSLAFETIARQPLVYIKSSGGLLLEHLIGSQQHLGGQGKSGGVVRYSDVQEKYGGFWNERTRPLIQNANAAQEREFRRAQTIANLLQPHRLAALLLPLLLAGAIASITSPSLRLGLVPLFTALTLLVLASFLAGDLPRYRYPADPLLAVVEMGGLCWLLSFVIRRLPPLRGIMPSDAPSASGVVTAGQDPPSMASRRGEGV